ncbi:uncharacterized protein LOC143788629 [Ranitomeya variabilis]|uniref:uncharacterized protein LOC143788629 n=1 Tax=Ranitomeya variabilis TaxID=490064 RepID=UPI0040579D5D
MPRWRRDRRRDRFRNSGPFNNSRQLYGRRNGHSSTIFPPSFVHSSSFQNIRMTIYNDYYTGNESDNQSDQRTEPARCDTPVAAPSDTSRGSEIENCPICLDVLQGDITSLLCRHSFHTTCLNTWLLEHQTCPLCRAVITSQHEEPMLPGEVMEEQGHQHVGTVFHVFIYENITVRIYNDYAADNESANQSDRTAMPPQ